MQLQLTQLYFTCGVVWYTQGVLQSAHTHNSLQTDRVVTDHHMHTIIYFKWAAIPHTCFINAGNEACKRTISIKMSCCSCRRAGNEMFARKCTAAAERRDVALTAHISSEQIVCDSAIYFVSSCVQWNGYSTTTA